MSRRNQGSIALARTGVTQDEIARLLREKGVNVGRAAVGHWVSGEARPNEEKRSLLRELFGIPETAWNDAPANPPREKSTDAGLVPVAPTRAAAPGDVMAYVAELEVMAVDLMRKVKDDVGATPLEQSRVMSQIAQTLSLLAKINGSFDLGSRVMKLPIWKRIEAALEKALDGHPEAAAAVAREFRALEG